MNLNINNICGESDGTFDLSSIANDPNFIFENDPNFEALKLYNSDGDAIFVNTRAIHRGKPPKIGGRLALTSYSYIKTPAHMHKLFNE